MLKCEEILFGEAFNVCCSFFWFNIILNEAEKKGGQPFQEDWRVHDLQRFIDTNALIDMGYRGHGLLLHGAIK